MRGQAAKAWARIERDLLRHLLSEDKVLQSAEKSHGLDHEAVERLRDNRRALRALADRLGEVSFPHDEDEKIVEAGEALCVLCVKIDDLIEGEERGLLPALQQWAFARS